MAAEVGVCVWEMEAAPATTFPLVGRATGGSNGTAGFAKTADEKRIVAAEKRREKLPANLIFAKQFFNDVFKESSELSFWAFFKTNTGLFPEPELSQRLISTGISSRVNVLKPPNLQAQF
jgi:hypothetical protein